MELTLAKFLQILGVAFAVGLDVFAISIAVGVSKVKWGTSLRMGAGFASCEILMQVIGYLLGMGAGSVIGKTAAYGGFVLLFVVGVLIFRNSLREHPEPSFDATKGAGLLLTTLSVSFDSLGVGIALPGVPIPELPLLITISITTTMFTLAGLAFGARLGQRFESRAEAAAGIILMILAIVFTVGKLLGGV